MGSLASSFLFVLGSVGGMIVGVRIGMYLSFPTFLFSPFFVFPSLLASSNFSAIP